MGLVYLVSSVVKNIALVTVITKSAHHEHILFMLLVGVSAVTVGTGEFSGQNSL